MIHREQLGEKFGINVQYTPTTLLVHNDGSEAVVLSEGMMTLVELKKRILAAGHSTGLLEDNIFEQSQDVRSITTVENDSLYELEVQENASVEDEVDILVKKMRRNLEKVQALFC